MVYNMTMNVAYNSYIVYTTQSIANCFVHLKIIDLTIFFWIKNLISKKAELRASHPEK